MKKCPYCAKELVDEAIHCFRCNASLTFSGGSIGPKPPMGKKFMTVVIVVEVISAVIFFWFFVAFGRSIFR